MKLHIFNPEHDLALAAHLRQFTAPHAGRQLRSDLAFIPALWADQGDLVLVDDIDNARDKVRHLGEHLMEKVEFITKLQLEHLLKTEFIDCVHPWGWDLSLKGELERIGLPEIMLPTDEVLDKVRAISSRQWAAEHLQQDVDAGKAGDYGAGDLVRGHGSEDATGYSYCTAPSGCKTCANRARLSTVASSAPRLMLICTALRPHSVMLCVPRAAFRNS